MEFKDALRQLMREQSLTDAHIAIAGGVSTSCTRKWLYGTTRPRYASIMALRSKYPRLAHLLDKKKRAS
jgi:hypothetical protein